MCIIYISSIQIISKIKTSKVIFFLLGQNIVPKMLLHKKNKAIEKETKVANTFPLSDKLCEHFYMLHQSCLKMGATPRQYLNFLQNYVNVYTTKKGGIEKRRGHLQVSCSVFLLFAMFSTNLYVV